MIDEAKTIEALYGRPGGSEPADQSVLDGTLLGGGFGNMETEARSEGDHAFARDLAGTRRGLVDGLSSLGVSQGAARELSALLRHYAEKAKEYTAPTPEQAGAAMERLLEGLGRDSDQVLADSRAIVQHLVAKAPALAGFIENSGIKFSPDFHKLLGAIGAHRRRSGSAPGRKGTPGGSGKSTADKLYGG